MRQLYGVFVVYVRPLLEYVTCVWAPHRVGEVNRVEYNVNSPKGYQGMTLSTIKVD